MDDEDLESETYFHFSFDVSFTRLMDTLLLPTKLNVKLGLEIIDDEEMEFALLKVRHWVQNHFTNCITLSSQNVRGFEALLDGNTPRLDNMLMITPGEPSDHQMMFILQSKIDAIADGAFLVCAVEIKSDNADGLTVTYIGDGSGELPQMKEWIAGPSWFDEPWWCRNDISMIDTIAPEDADLTVRPAWAATFDFLKTPQNAQPALVLRGNFEPKIVGDDK